MTMDGQKQRIVTVLAQHGGWMLSWDLLLQSRAENLTQRIHEAREKGVAIKTHRGERMEQTEGCFFYKLEEGLDTALEKLRRRGPTKERQASLTKSSVPIFCANLPQIGPILTTPTEVSMAARGLQERQVEARRQRKAQLSLIGKEG